ncbi:MAG: hypothetical protein ACREV5_14905 [Steroidobacter sp.]
MHPIFGIDTYRATKPSPYPFSAVTPATDISLDVSEELAAMYEQLRIEGAANGLKRSYINLSRILSETVNESVLSVCSDDDGNDFACLSRSGAIISGSAKCEKYIVRFGPSNASRCPAPEQHHLHALASEAATSFLGFPASDLGFGSFDPPEYFGFKNA